MTLTHYRRSKKCAVIGVAFIALGIVGLSTSPAIAAPGEAGSGSITVYKLEQGAKDLGASDGSPLNTAGASPLVAGFTACAIDGIDLASASAWDRIARITLTGGINGAIPSATESGKAFTLTCGPEQKTNATSGATTFASLAADRAYVVYESTLAKNAVTSAQPTIVTVPYPGTPSSAAWNYNPHIYPKNVIAGSGATKTGEIVGDKVTFTVTLPINPLPGKDPYSEARINDKLSSSLKYTDGTVILKAADGTNVALTSGTHYTVTTPDGSTGSEVVANLTEAGLKLINANIGGRIVLTIKADATASGNTANEAVITINGKSTDPGTGPDVKDPKSYYSGAHIMKFAKNRLAASTVPLAGAQFTLYAADSAATSCDATPDTAKAPVLSGQTSNAAGRTPDAVLAAGKYCVYETLTPAGYKGLNGGLLFTVTGEKSRFEVVNRQIGSDEGDLPSLPMTGGAGSVALIVSGASLLTTGLALFMIRRRKAAVKSPRSIIG